MNLADLRADFLDELLHDECTDEKANRFIAKALRRIQRECRLPCMESEEVYTATTVPLSALTIPSDLLSPIHLAVPAAIAPSAAVATDGEAIIDQVSFASLQRIALQDEVQGWSRRQGSFYVRGQIPVGSTVRLIYYAAGPDLTADTDETAIMAAAPELVLYAALAYAGIVYEKPQVTTWESAFQSTKDAVDQQARDLDWGGGPMVVRPTHEA